MASDHLRPRRARPPVKPTPKDTHPRPGQFGHLSRAATHREIAARGGRKAHQLRTEFGSGVHEFTPEEATEAARKSSLLKRNAAEQAQRQQRINERLATKGVSDDAPVSDESD